MAHEEVRKLGWSLGERGRPRSEGVKIVDPVAHVKACQGRRMPRTTAHLRRQHVSPVVATRALMGPAGLVTRIGILSLGVVPISVVRPALGVLAAGISHQYRSPLDAVTRPSIRRAPVDGVLVVETPARRVQFYQLIAHCGWMTQCLH